MVDPQPEPSTAAAGVARLQRAVEARSYAARGRHARAQRLLQRCAGALAARGCPGPATAASCALGYLYLDRGQPEKALLAFEQARRWSGDPAGSTAALIGTGRALTEQGRLLDAEAALRTAVLGVEGGDAAQCLEAHRGLALALFLRGRLDAAEEALGARDPALLSQILRAKGDLGAAAHAAARAINESPETDPIRQCEAHLASMRVHAALGHMDEVRRHAQAASHASRRSRVPALRLRAAAEAISCDVAATPAARRRLVSAARRLPPLAAARVRAALRGAEDAAEDEALTRFIDMSGAVALGPAPPGAIDLIHRFQSLLDAIHDSPDEAAALQVIAADLLAAVEAVRWWFVRRGSAGRRRRQAGRGRRRRR